MVGIGLVGTALAENLLANDFEVIGFARREAKRAELVRLGGRAVLSLGEVAQAADRVILSLPDSAVVEEGRPRPGGFTEDWRRYPCHHRHHHWGTGADRGPGPSAPRSGHPASGCAHLRFQRTDPKA